MVHVEAGWLSAQQSLQWGQHPHQATLNTHSRWWPENLLNVSSSPVAQINGGKNFGDWQALWTMCALTTHAQNATNPDLHEVRINKPLTWHTQGLCSISSTLTK